MTKKILIPESKLNDLYINKRLSSYKIAKIYGCDPTVIQKRLMENNITPRRKLRINISKNLLKELYWNKGLSSYKIAKELGIGRTTIYSKLIDYGIGTRHKNFVKLSKAQLKELYYKKRLSISKIAKKYDYSVAAILNKMKFYGLNRRSNSEANTLYKKKKFNGDKYLKAYMLGFRVGDLYITKPSENSTSYKLNTSTTKIEQINLIRTIFGGYGHFYCKKIGNSYNINCYLHSSFKFLLPKKDRIDNWILNNNNYFLAFLGGYTDAEGNIGIYSNKARYRVGSYDKKILLQIYKKLNKIGINAKFGLEQPRGVYGNRKYNNDFYRVSVNCKADLLNLLSLLEPYIKHKKRYSNLIAAERNIIERNKKQF